MPHGVVVGFLGIDRDSSDRAWRPTVWIAEQAATLSKLAGISKLKKLELLVPEGERHEAFWKELAAICKEKCHDLIVSKYILKANLWDPEETMDALLHYVKTIQADTSEAKYLVHTGTGTHIGLTCIYSLVDSGIFNASLLQTIPPSRGNQCFKIISPKSQALLNAALERANQREIDLKQNINTKNKLYNDIIHEIEIVAISSGANVLLLGETGVGKTYLAKHIAEKRKELGQIESFFEVNCATLKGDLVSSTLFGHKKGAFSGATENRTGMLKQADRGLLFLDEIGDLGLQEQAMLLKAIEEKKFYPVGSDKEEKSDFQLICGTNKDLASLVKQGTFRSDLLARIAIWSFIIPPLRKRSEDIPANLEHELARVGAPRGKKVWMNAGAKNLFLDFAQSQEATWPGNLRDFSSAIVRMGTLSPTGEITEPIVEKEISRLKALWNEAINEPSACALPDSLDQSKFDIFDLHTLEAVLKVCKNSRTLSEAGRTLFNVSRDKKKKANDATRLREYLNRFGLDFTSIKR